MLRIASVFVILTVALAVAKPQQAVPSPDASVTVVSSTSSDDAAGNFAYAFELSNQIKADAKGQPKQITGADGQPAQGEVQQGSYSFVAPDGQTYKIDWIADENGFQPKGDHIPVAPPAPAQ